jgi:hypothetical protein
MRDTQVAQPRAHLKVGCPSIDQRVRALFFLLAVFRYVVQGWSRLTLRMSRGWSESDKAVAKVAAERARRRAEQETIKLHQNYKIENIDDLWRLELRIREWRKERQHRFTLNYEIASKQLAHWLAKGWLQESDLARLSPERLNEITNI